MDTFVIAFKTVLPLFLVIFIGMGFTRTKIKVESWIEVLNKYALWIGFPALVVYSLMKLKPEGNFVLSVVIINSLFILASLFLVFPVTRLFGLSVNLKRTLFLIVPFGNVSFLGIPVLYNVFGDDALPVAAIISAVYVF